VKKKVKVDIEKVRKLAFPKDGSKGLNYIEIAKKLNCTGRDVMKAMRKWMSERIYDPISRKWK
jgi:hypothetical protein